MTENFSTTDPYIRREEIEGGSFAPAAVVATGAVTTSSPTANFGFATGAGGAVTQLTSKSTTVVINTNSGQITMNNAALATVTTVSFTVTNSAISATDNVIVNLLGASYATTATYAVKAEKIAAGSFVISLKNESGGTLSEAVVVNFSIISGVTA